MTTSNIKRPIRPHQKQDHQPGSQEAMTPAPQAEAAGYQSAGRLHGRATLVTGGDSGIGRAVAVAFAKEGADVVVAYLNETKDAEETKRLIEETGRECVLVAGDLGDEDVCRKAIATAVEHFGHLDVLVNNAAEQHPRDNPHDITAEQVEKTFRTNVFSAFHLIRHAMPHLPKGACIINTTSVVAYRGSAHLVDYAATKGALLGLTRSLALALVSKGIRVNAVAPGPIWTPLIPSTFDAEHTAKFGSDVPMGRAGEPDEVAPAFVYLASADSSYVTGQCLHVNGGEVVNG